MSKSSLRTPPPGRGSSLREREAYWKRHVDRWRASGLSQSEYSRQEGLRSNQLSYWYRRDQLSKEEKERVSSAGFVPLQVVTAVEVENLSVKLPSGVVIEGVTASNVEVVRELVAQL